MPKERVLTKSEIADLFAEDPDVIEATRMYAMRLYSLQEFSERMAYKLEFFETRLVEFEEEYPEYDEHESCEIPA